jgi:hypothetical protein
MAQILVINGINVNIAKYLEDISDQWARQLYIYGRILGEDVGTNFIAGIEQLACKPVYEMPPAIRVASFRSRISAAYQQKIEDQIAEVWTAITTKKFFEENNEEQMRELDTYYQGFKGESADDKWFNDVTRSV